MGTVEENQLSVKIHLTAFLIPSLLQTQINTTFILIAFLYCVLKAKLNTLKGGCPSSSIFLKSGLCTFVSAEPNRSTFVFFRIRELCSIKLMAVLKFFTGDSWNIKQLRGKSSEDLHKLW